MSIGKQENKKRPLMVHMQKPNFQILPSLSSPTFIVFAPTENCNLNKKAIFMTQLFWPI